MPPSSNNPLIASLSRQSFLGTSPDNDSGSTEPEAQPKLNKKARKKQARDAARGLYDIDPSERPFENDVTERQPPPAPPPVAAQPPAPVSSLLSQIPHSFPKPQKFNATPLSEEQFGDVVGEKVSDQSTPPYDDDFFRDVSQSKSPPREPIAPGSFGIPPQAQPGFSTRAGFDSKSPPISPSQRYARPVSYGGGIATLPSHTRMSSLPYSRTTSQYGSPPAPHLPQPHFYRAQDVEVPIPSYATGTEAQEPTLVKHTLIPSRTGEPRPGVLLGYHGRVSLFSLDRDKFDEVGAITGLPGTVTDALVLPTSHVAVSSTKTDRLIAIVLHGSKETDSQAEQAENIPGYPGAGVTRTEYITSVEVYSLASQQHVATVLETPPMLVQSYRGIVPDIPSPVGSLKLFCSDKQLVVASGTSGEVFIITITTDEFVRLECLGKLWTAVQHQMKRRDSSHGRSSDTDISPADLNRGIVPEERAIIDLSGRWLAISPASLPSRPSLNVRLGPDIVCRKHAGIESITAPTKPSISCEVDSPDADTMLGKVARGVAQELVKGAKWLGDQGYQTWQNYWKKDQSPPTSLPQQPYSPPTFLAQRTNNAFPPTHAETLPASKEPEIVSIYDLIALHDSTTKRKTDELRPVATFQPPRGCSFVSFAPNGLNLLTAGRKGDVQYLWDLMQIRYCRAFVAAAEDDRIQSQPRVRQIARFERLSGSTIVDIAWESPHGARFAILTQNRTVHIFDLPSNFLRWPPPRTIRKVKQAAQMTDTSLGAQDNNQSGFLASAMNIASKAQPMMAGWRGRAPSMGGGLAGIGQTGIGLATATGARSSKAVAAGLSKSLGAASETVSHLRHAGESRLHIKSNHKPAPGRMAWVSRGINTGLSILDSDAVKFYRVRKTKPQDRGYKGSTSVFDTRKATGTKLPRSFELRSTFADSGEPGMMVTAGQSPVGFYKLEDSSRASPQSLSHPLSYAEIETNAPYQPFHSDRRVSLCIFAGGSSSGKISRSDSQDQWVFGDEVPVFHVNLARVQVAEDEEGGDSIIYRETTMSTDVGQGGMEHIVSTTRRGRKKKVDARTQHEDDDLIKDDFFEDDCEVLDFATDRV